jgi:hypothetical protein
MIWALKLAILIDLSCGAPQLLHVDAGLVS